MRPLSGSPIYLGLLLLVPLILPLPGTGQDDRAADRAAPKNLADDDRFQQKDTGKQIVLSWGDQPILAYNYGTIEPPEGIDRIYARSGYIHPLYTPAGKRVTDDFSSDHAHQHGLFYAFVKARVEGELLDFWNQHQRTANVKHAAVVGDRGDPTRLTTRQLHYRLRDDKTVFEETWQIEVSRQFEMFVIDLRVEITNVTDQQITIEKNHYGSFGLRGAADWRDAQKSEFEFLTASGKNRETGNLARERWVALQGRIDGEHAGVAVWGHPENLRYPQPARLHPTMPYFSFAPMAVDGFEMQPGEKLSSRFRLVTFDGPLDREQLERLAPQP